MKRDTILDAWCNGYAAAHKGVSIANNPYPDQPRLSEVWARAWQKSRIAKTAGLPAPPLALWWR